MKKVPRKQRGVFPEHGLCQVNRSTSTPLGHKVCPSHRILRGDTRVNSALDANPDVLHRSRIRQRVA